MNTNELMSYIDTGEGFPVLLGHSYLFDKHMWADQIKFLSKNYRVIAPDLWGHGDSPPLPSSVQSLENIAQDHLNLMDSLGIDKFAIIGLSVGGMWAVELVAIAPERVAGIMLCDTYVGEEGAVLKDKYFKMLDDIDHHGAIQPALIEEIVPIFHSQFASQEDVSALALHLSSLSAENLRDSIVPLGRIIFGRGDRRALLEDITCVAQVATGEFDIPRPPAEGQEMANILRSGFTLISNAGHISNREQPAIFNNMIENFMERIEV